MVCERARSRSYLHVTEEFIFANYDRTTRRTINININKYAYINYTSSRNFTIVHGSFSYEKGVCRLVESVCRPHGYLIMFKQFNNTSYQLVT